MKSKEVEVILSLGSNVGDALANLAKAYLLLEQNCGEIVQVSSYYESEPWGFEADQNFVNTALILKTKLLPLELLDELKSIETQMGRDISPQKGYSSRIIDIDIIDYNQEVVTFDRLQIPHRYMKERCFVLQPLLEICPDYQCPLSVDFDLTSTVEILNCSSILKIIPTT